MPFIVPFIPLIAAGVGAAVGGISAHKQQGIQQQGQQDQNAIAQQEMQDKQKIFNQLMPFFSQYMQSGSPFLQNIQSATAGQESQQYNNAAGQARQQLQSAGTGYGPSGNVGAVMGGLGQGEAQSSASNYLQNLLNNEQIKFQAAQGLNTAGAMAGASQNQPNVSTNIPAANLGSSVFGGGQAIASSIPKATPPTTGGGTDINNLPLGNTNPNAPSIFNMPTVGGYG